MKISLFKKNHLERGSTTLEAAISLAIYLLLLCIFFILLIIRYIQLAYFDTSLNVSKELGLAYAFYSGYTLQNSSLDSEKANQSSELKILTEDSIFKGKNVEFIKNLLNNQLDTTLSKPLLAKRINIYWQDSKIADYYKKRLKDIGYKLILPNTQKNFYRGYIISTGKIDLIFYNYNFHLKLPFFTYSGKVREKNNITKNSKPKEESANPWNYHNFKRGRYFIKKIGNNLPANYPTIHHFLNGQATMIKSIDLTAPSYQNRQELEELIDFWLLKLKTFSGNEKAFGKEKIIISNAQIKARKLIVVIPTNSPDYLKKILENKLANSGISYEINELMSSNKYKEKQP